MKLSGTNQNASLCISQEMIEKWCKEGNIASLSKYRESIAKHGYMAMGFCVVSGRNVKKAQASLVALLSYHCIPVRETILKDIFDLRANRDIELALLTQWRKRPNSPLAKLDLSDWKLITNNKICNRTKHAIIGQAEFTLDMIHNLITCEAYSHVSNIVQQTELVQLAVLDFTETNATEKMCSHLQELGFPLGQLAQLHFANFRFDALRNFLSSGQLKLNETAWTKIFLQATHQVCYQNHDNEIILFHRRVLDWLIENNFTLNLLSQEILSLTLTVIVNAVNFPLFHYIMCSQQIFPDNVSIEMISFKKSRTKSLALVTQYPTLISSYLIGQCVLENDKNLYEQLWRLYPHEDRVFCGNTDMQNTPLFKKHLDNCLSIRPRDVSQLMLNENLGDSIIMKCFEKMDAPTPKQAVRLLDCSLFHNRRTLGKHIITRYKLSSKDLTNMIADSFMPIISWLLQQIDKSEINLNSLRRLLNNNFTDPNTLSKFIVDITVEEIQLLKKFYECIVTINISFQFERILINREFIENLKNNKKQLNIFSMQISGNHRRTWQLMQPNFDASNELLALNPVPFNLTVYQDLLPIIESEVDNGVNLFAYRLACLFASKSQAIDYINEFQQRTQCDNPFHDACLFSIPMYGNYNKSLWRNWLQGFNWSPRYMSLLVHAPLLERAINGTLPSLAVIKENHKSAETSGGMTKRLCAIIKFRVRKYRKTQGAQLSDEDIIKIILPSDHSSYLPKLLKTKIAFSVDGAFAAHVRRRREFTDISYVEATDLIIRSSYQGTPENLKAFALTCLRAGVRRDTFEKCVELLKITKKQDFVPDVKIDGEQFGYANVVFQKMSNTDPLRFILGKLTACCQSIDGHSNDVVIHGAHTPYGGFYQLILHYDGGYKWLAQSWASLTEDWDLVFDSIELPHGSDKERILKFYEIAATKILMDNPRINRVLAGCGGNTPSKFTSFPHTPKPFSRLIGYKDIGYDSVNMRITLAQQGALRPAITACLTPSVIEQPQWDTTEAIDTYVKPGNKVTTLRMAPAHRAAFLREHPRVAEQIKQVKHCKLLEEGFYTAARAEGFGEAYLTTQQLQELLDIKILQKRHTDDRYKITDAKLFDNDLQAVRQWLTGAPLNNNDCWLVTYVKGVHVIGAAVYKHNDQISVVYIDPEKPDVNNCLFAATLKHCFGNANLYACNALLQKDYYSCGVIVIKAFMFFAKQGLEWTKQLPPSASAWHLINESELPARLLKLTQYPLNEKTLENKGADPVNQKQTLIEYLAQYRQQHLQKKFNSAALQTRYRFYHALESHSVTAPQAALSNGVC